MNLERVPALDLFPLAEFRDHWWIRSMFGEMEDVFVTDDPTPPGSFNTFFRVINRLDYGGDKMKQCLRYLHELRHLRGFETRGPITHWQSWQRAMGHSERDASVTSEGVVHFLIPSARAAFPPRQIQELWVDRRLDERKYRYYIGQTDAEQVGVLHHMLAEDRLRAFNTPTDNDHTEWQIANYGQQNMHWYVIWAYEVGVGPHRHVAAWRAVEEHFARADWRDRHADWLEEVSGIATIEQLIVDRHADWSDETSEDVVTVQKVRMHTPFPRQAVKFARIYHQSNELYGNWPYAT